MANKKSQEKIGVVGLGYVGLPLAVEFAQNEHVIGFDVNSERVQQLSAGQDITREAEAEKLQQADIEYTDNPERLKN